MTVRGWKAGLNKVRLTRIFRDGGLPLGDAVEATERVLNGHAVRVHLAQFEEIGAARSALAAAGVEEIIG